MERRAVGWEHGVYAIDQHRSVLSTHELLRAIGPDPAKVHYILAADGSDASIRGLKHYMHAVGVPNVVAIVGEGGNRIGAESAIPTNIGALSVRAFEYSAGQRIDWLSGIAENCAGHSVILDIGRGENSAAFALLQALLEATASDDCTTQLAVHVTQSDAFDRVCPEPTGVAWIRSGRESAISDERHVADGVWIPVLGGSRVDELSNLEAHFGAMPCRPVLPFPSPDPFATDRSLRSLAAIRPFEFSSDAAPVWRANAVDPYDIYRTVSEAYSSLSSLPGVNVHTGTASAHGNGLLALGTFMAAFAHDLRFGIDPQARMQSPSDACVWLRGEPYWS